MQNATQLPANMREPVPFKVDGLAISFAESVPRRHNFCKLLNFRQGLSMPAGSFCSSENQGLPRILLTKHFETFPFNHERVGGIVATSRRGPQAQHSEDSVIVQASHGGCGPDPDISGRYQRSSRMAGKTDSDGRDRLFLHQGENGRRRIGGSPERLHCCHWVM